MLAAHVIVNKTPKHGAENSDVIFLPMTRLGQNHTCVRKWYSSLSSTPTLTHTLPYLKEVSLQRLYEAIIYETIRASLGVNDIIYDMIEKWGISKYSQEFS